MNAKKTIWVVRHAQSNHQIGLQEETCDCDLSPEGFRQADTLAGRLAGVHPDVVIVSAMKRAQQTFMGSKITAPRMEVDSRAIEGGTYPELAGVRPPLSPLLRPDVHDAALVDTMPRATSLLADILAMPEPEVMLFSHCYFLSCFARLFLSAVETLAWNAVKLHNTGIGKLVVEEDDIRRIWLWDAWADWAEERTM